MPHTKDERLQVKPGTTKGELKMTEPIDDYVAWCRYDGTTIVTCDSDKEGAFRVYRRNDWQLEASRDEYRKRYRQSLALLQRCVKAMRRQGWQEGESETEALGAVETFLSYERLEQEWIKKGIL